MKAVRFHEHGGPERLRFEEIDEPKCGPGDILVEVKAASVNHLDVWVRKGMPGMKIPLPRIPGSDAAGVVVETGSGTAGPKVGARVLLNPGLTCGRCEFCAGGEGSLCRTYVIFGEHRDGTYAERIAVPAHNCIPIPDALSFEEAAAVPLVFLTAWRMLVTRGRVRAGEDVLVIGAGAGVGTACVQIAKLSGARVIATAGSEEKCGRLRQLGADVVIDHSREDLLRRVREITAKRGVDLVVDYVGKETWGKSLQALRRGGRLVTCGATTGYDPTEDLRQIFYRQLEILGCTMGSDKELTDVLRCVFDGRLKAVVDRALPLRDAPEAHRLLESRKVFGKLILVP